MASALPHFEAHRAGTAFDDLRRGVEVVGVQVLHLHFGDLTQLRAADGARADLAGLARPLLDPRRLLQEEARRRGLGRETERTVGIDGDDRRDRRAALELLRRRVERLADFPDVDAALSERGADR